MEALANPISLSSSRDVTRDISGMAGPIFCGHHALQPVPGIGRRVHLRVHETRGNPRDVTRDTAGMKCISARSFPPRHTSRTQ